MQRETFARIRAANGSPALADVPPDQDAEEFELHFADGVELDVLTSKDPRGPGAIARYLARFGEGIQQVEFLCLDVERATLILRERFGIAPLYPQARPGAGRSTINFFLVPVPDAAAESRKVLIELYQLPVAPSSALRSNDLSRSAPAYSPLCSINLATSPVQPVWWSAPSPAPFSPLKYS